MLYVNLFLLFSSLYNHLKPFLKFRPPFILIPFSLNFGFFPTPPPPRLFGTWEYQKGLILTYSTGARLTETNVPPVSTLRNTLIVYGF